MFDQEDARKKFRQKNCWMGGWVGENGVLTHLILERPLSFKQKTNLTMSCYIADNNSVCYKQYFLKIAQ